MGRAVDLLPPPLGEGWGGGQRRTNASVAHGLATAAPIPAFPQRGKESDRHERPDV